MRSKIRSTSANDIEQSIFAIVEPIAYASERKTIKAKASNSHDETNTRKLLDSTTFLASKKAGLFVQDITQSYRELC